MEETYSGSTAMLYALNVIGADGWRARHYVGNQFYAFSFDPEGNAISRQNSFNSLYNAYATSSFEAYGNRGNDYSVTSGVHPASVQQPARFGGQYGYYTDYSTGLLCLTHRYYDPGTGKFITRDPIGYGGGVNLYGFADGNPVNESDPSGDAPKEQPEGYIDTEKVRFSQNGYSENFSSGKYRTVTALAQALKSGAELPSDVEPIHLFMYNGSIYTIDNRRLVAFHQAGKEIPYCWATEAEKASFIKHFSTENGGAFIEPNADIKAGTDVMSRFSGAASKLGEGANVLGGLLFFEKEWGEVGWILSNKTPSDYKNYRRFLWITNPDKYRTLPSQHMYEFMYRMGGA